MIFNPKRLLGASWANLGSVHRFRPYENDLSRCVYVKKRRACLAFSRRERSTNIVSFLICTFTIIEENV